MELEKFDPVCAAVLKKTEIEKEIKETEANLEDDESWGDNLYTP